MAIRQQQVGGYAKRIGLPVELETRSTDIVTKSAKQSATEGSVKTPVEETVMAAVDAPKAMWVYYFFFAIYIAMAGVKSMPSNFSLNDRPRHKHQ